jgi:hypothetical protein
VSRLKPEQKTAALTALVFAHGNVPAAQAALAEDDIKIHERTLYRIKSDDPEYHRLARELADEVKTYEIERRRSLAAIQTEASRKMTEELIAESHELSARDKAGAIRNLDTGSAINIDKAQLLAGEPTEIREQRKPEEILRALRAKLGVKPSIEGEAVEEPIQSIEKPAEAG